MAALTSALLLGGGAALAGAAINSSAVKSAAKKTSAAAQQASENSLSAAQEVAQSARDTSKENNALLADIYGKNTQALQPSMQTGTAAQDAINSFLGLPVYKDAKDYAGYVDSNPDILANFDKYGSQFGGDKAAFGQWFSDNYGSMNPAKVGTERVLDAEAPQRQEQAFGAFRDATGYQDQLAQGVAAIDQSAAARGGLNSGGTLKALQKYGTGLANQSAGQYLNYLTGQQAVGANATNALVGVGNQFATNTAANNTNANNAASNALLGATGASNNYLTSAADTNAQAGLAQAGQVSNLLGQAVSAYGAASGTSSYARPQGYGASTYAPPVNDAYSGVY